MQDCESIDETMNPPPPGAWICDAMNSTISVEDCMNNMNTSLSSSSVQVEKKMFKIILYIFPI